MFKTINEAILEAFKREGKPLRVKEVFLRIQEDGLYNFNTSTPEHVVRTALRRHTENLNFASSHKKKLFVTLTDGRYWVKGKATSGISKVEKKDEGFTASYQSLLALQKQHLEVFKQAMLNRLKNLEPSTFEIFCRQLLIAYGFKNVKVTKVAKDGGIDGFGELKIGLSFLHVAFQCKRWNSTSVGRPEIDKFRGAIQGLYQQGIYFTTSKFTKDAKSVNNQVGAVPIALFDGMNIVDVMIDKGFGVEAKELPLYIDALDEVFDRNLKISPKIKSE